MGIMKYSGKSITNLFKISFAAATFLNLAQPTLSSADEALPFTPLVAVKGHATAGSLVGNYVGGFLATGDYSQIECQLFRWSKDRGTETTSILPDDFCYTYTAVNAAGDVFGSSNSGFGIFRADGTFVLNPSGFSLYAEQVGGMANTQGEIASSQGASVWGGGRDFVVYLRNFHTADSIEIYRQNISASWGESPKVFGVNDRRSVALTTQGEGDFGKVGVILVDPNTQTHESSPRYSSVDCNFSNCSIQRFNPDDSVIFSSHQSYDSHLIHKVVWKFDPRTGVTTEITRIESYQSFDMNSRGDILIHGIYGPYQLLEASGEIHTITGSIEGHTPTSEGFLGLTEDGIPVAIENYEKVFALRKQSSAGRTDLNFDGMINTSDLILLQNRFGKSPIGDKYNADFNADGLVNTPDLTRFLSTFGRTSR